MPRAGEHRSLVNQTFGRLTVIEDLGKVSSLGGHSYYRSRCRCSCGNEKDVTNEHLVHLKIRSCGCLRRGEASDDAFYNVAVGKIRRGALSRGLAFELTHAEVLQIIKQPCHWCGDSNGNKLTGHDLPNGRPGCNGIDRLDNAKGYIAGNVVPCCWPCNRMKGQLSETAFLERCRLIIAHVAARM